MTNAPTNLNEQVAELLKLGKEGSLKAVEFIQQQAPEVIEQYLAWSFWSNTFSAIALLVLAIFLAYFAYRLFKTSDDEFDSFPVTIMAVMALLLTIGFFHTSCEAIKIKIAPKVYLIEKAAEILK